MHRELGTVIYASCLSQSRLHTASASNRRGRPHPPLHNHLGETWTSDVTGASLKQHWRNPLFFTLKEKKNTCLADLALLLNVKWCWSHVPILRSFSFSRADEARACVTTAVSRCGHSRPRRISCCNHHWSKNLFIYSWNPDGYACSLTNFSVQLQIAHVFFFSFIWHTYLS